VNDQDNPPETAAPGESVTGQVHSFDSLGRTSELKPRGRSHLDGSKTVLMPQPCRAMPRSVGVKRDATKGTTAGQIGFSRPVNEALTHS